MFMLGTLLLQAFEVNLMRVVWDVHFQFLVSEAILLIFYQGRMIAVIRKIQIERPALPIEKQNHPKINRIYPILMKIPQTFN